jgi:hypothetical protein
MRCLVVVVAGLVCSVSSVGHAEPEASKGNHAALNWSRQAGAEDCPDVSELAKRVNMHLKRDAFVSPAAAQVLIDAVIESVEPQGFRVRVTISSADATPGVRELESPGADCSDAVDAAALAIALMIDPNVLSSDAAPEAVPISEICAILGCPAQTAYARLHAARRLVMSVFAPGDRP